MEVECDLGDIQNEELLRKMVSYKFKNYIFLS